MIGLKFVSTSQLQISLLIYFVETVSIVIGIKFSFHNTRNVIDLFIESNYTFKIKKKVNRVLFSENQYGEE